MRPLSLTLRAFGSYAGELCIDFARLSRHGVFAISGPTGAGKSTIFDALVYALYDDLPGFRVDGNVRSQFADPSTSTWVSLDFVVHGDRWRIERCPTQLVRRPRGRDLGAPHEKKSEAVLGRVGNDGELVPGTILTRKNDVRRRIDVLLGLTKDQFEQVVLIPQGRFEEVLKADTQKRAPLLRRLFPVEVFTRTTESLKVIASARQVEFEEATRSYGAVVERLQDARDAAVAQLPDDVRDEVFGADVDADVGVEDPRLLQVENLDCHLEVLAEALRCVDERVARLASHAKAVRARLDDARRAAADWDHWQADLKLSASFEEGERRDAGDLAALERARRVTDLRGALAEWQEATRRLRTLEPELAGLVEAIESAWPDELHGAAWAGARADAHEAGMLAERFGADARRLDREIGRFDRLVKTGLSLGSQRNALEQRGFEVAERALKLGAEEQSVELVADEVRALRVEASALDAHAAAVTALEREHQMASRRAGASAELDRLGAELAVATTVATRAAERADAARTSWRDGLAGRLAQLLEDGSPCPTCGALEHPAPAKWPGDGDDGTDVGADDGALDDAERAREEAVKVRSDAEQRVAMARGVIGALAETRPLDAVDADLTARRDVLRVVRDAADRLVVVAAEEKRRRSALLEARSRLGEDTRSLENHGARLEADMSAHERAVEEFTTDHGAFESPAPRAAVLTALSTDVQRLARVLRDVETARGLLRHSCAVVEPVARALDATDPGELLTWVLDPDELASRTAALEQRRSGREEVSRRIAEFEARLGSGCSAGDDTSSGAFVRPDVESLEAFAEASASEHVALVERRAVLADRVAVLAGGPAEVAEAGRSLDAARVALEQAKTIADRCGGLGGGPSFVRLSLENWVLADYLRQVLVQANHRLDAMTDGRYVLELCDGVTDGRKPWGLDLAVFDANTGQVRSATTLSGGETFMAALALALGLADVVSGGSNREVGALFVDEGFGSLDAQSLDAVIDVLRSLEDGGRIVGIISHVRELQLALPSGITVEPSAGGSLAKVHYPPE